MEIRKAIENELDIIAGHDRHISRAELEQSIRRGRVYIVYEGGEFIGWLRYGLFWDNTPFMNMLYFLEEYRGKGYGRKLVEAWENDMRAEGYEHIMTSTASDEYSQHFYVRLGYTVVGGFTPHGEPYELMLKKTL